MNKLKLLYDVVKTLRDKETICGVLTAEVTKDQDTIFALENHFDKDLQTGRTKAKITTEVNYQHNILKHESATEWTMHGLTRDRRFGGHHMHGHDRRRGLQAGFDRLSFALSMLNALHIIEQPDKTVVISLKSDELPSPMLALLKERISHAGGRHCHGFHSELQAIEDVEFEFNVSVSNDYAVEKVNAAISATNNDNQHNKHSFQGRINIDLTGQ